MKREEHCSVYVPRSSGLASDCERTPTTLIDGKWYCKFHEPVRVKARFQKRMDSYNKGMAIWRERHDRDMLLSGIFAAVKTEIIKKREADIRKFASSLK